MGRHESTFKELDIRDLERRITRFAGSRAANILRELEELEEEKGMVDLHEIVQVMLRNGLSRDSVVFLLSELGFSRKEIETAMFEALSTGHVEDTTVYLGGEDERNKRVSLLDRLSTERLSGYD